MKWPTHLLIAFVIYLLFVRIGLLELDVLVVLGLAVGSVIPDIDHPQSLLGKVVKYRGIVHSLLALGVSVVMLYALLSAYNASLIVFGFSFGYLLHLVTDSLTPMGVKWLQPFKGGSIRFIIRTGGFGESILAFLFAILLILLLLQHYGIPIPSIPIKLEPFMIMLAEDMGQSTF